AFAADEELLAGPQQVAAAGRGVVLLERGEELAERDAERDQPVGKNLDLVGLQLAAEGVDLDDAGDRAQLEPDEPVEQGPELHRRVTGGRVRLAGLARAIAPHLELQDLAEAGAHRGERGDDAGRKIL